MIELFTLFILYVIFLAVTVFFYKKLNPPPPKPPVLDYVAINFNCAQCGMRSLEKEPETVLGANGFGGWSNYYICKVCVKKIALEESWLKEKDENQI